MQHLNLNKDVSPILQKRKREFAWIERISVLMDSKFQIGGFRFGLDPLLNLIPFAGQTISFGTSFMLVIIMMRNGAGSKVAVKMLLNVLTDAVLGAIPFFGQVFDFFNKANKKNVKLLKEHYFEGKHQGSAKGILFGILVALVVICIVFLFLLWKITTWTFEVIGSIF